MASNELWYARSSSGSGDVLTPSAEFQLEIRDSAGKGKGIFATADAPMGTIVLQEPGVVVVDHFELGDIEFPRLTQYQDIIQQWDALPDSMKGFLESLHFADHSETTQSHWETFLKSQPKEGDEAPKEHARRILAFYSNAHDYRGYDGKQQRALFPVASRFNHSCDPNVLAEVSRAGIMYYIATRDIPEGEELRISYVPPNHNTGSRLKALMDGWEFMCDCPRCARQALPSPRVDFSRLFAYTSLVERHHVMIEVSILEWREELWLWMDAHLHRIVVAQANDDPLTLYFSFRSMASAFKILARDYPPSIFYPAAVFAQEYFEYLEDATAVARDRLSEFPVFAVVCEQEIEIRAEIHELLESAQLGDYDL
ncbi:uncharacterized protein B0I36DRAFT_350838 [Microdochium trichocladiopsis]|uniref:SET domain-containing protein n=1 Tax=Microdochium trichocladiopsis TaxID=1682393 RepID=A0A9P9BKQ1_9PEZI|nr:uncharacterized protein B0I36DRAFT_350838 [Microdochium trichocladiopsis]KAH7027277.1 hypothetical protein B0I36DRAFT_350838 [Microdochium trichocladiopsis]